VGRRRRREPPAEDAAAVERRAVALRRLLPDLRAVRALHPLDPRCAYAALIGRLDLVETWHADGAAGHHDRWRES
jgi:hypothetical protein